MMSKVHPSNKIQTSLTHFIGHFHFHVLLLECSHIASDFFRSHYFIHFTHCFRCGCHRAADCDIGSHGFILESNAWYFTVSSISTVFLFSYLNQLLCQQSACIFIAFFGIFLYLGFLNDIDHQKCRKLDENIWIKLRFSFPHPSIFGVLVQCLVQLFAGPDHCHAVALQSISQVSM